MTVETTIQQMINQCPDLFSTRQECCDFLFCVIGNGYEWKRGQLVYCGDESTEEDEAADYAALTAAREACGIRPKAVQSETNIAEKGKADIGSHDPNKRRWYPICEYSLINGVPKDVKPDWKAAVEECKAMLRADGINI